MIRNVPHLALIPLVILWFGIDEEAKLFLVALGVFFPIYINTLHGIRTVDPQLVEMGRIYGMSPRQLFRRVILPGALPSIFVGLRYALGIMWLTLIVAETIAASSGIGYMAMQAREFLLVDVVVLEHRDLRAARQARRQRRAAARTAVRCRGIPPSRSIEEPTMTRRMRAAALGPAIPYRARRRLAPAKRVARSGRSGLAARHDSRPAQIVRRQQVLRGIDLESRRASSSPSSAKAAAARARCCGCWSGSTKPTRGTLLSSAKAARSARPTRASCSRSRGCCPGRACCQCRVGLGADASGRCAQRALAALRRGRADDSAPQWPAVLSGGQKQRVALARALVSDPQVLALDEPLGALDALTRIAMQAARARLARQGFTAMLVTHDVAEAVALADRVIVIEEGRIALDSPSTCRARANAARPRSPPGGRNPETVA